MNESLVELGVGWSTGQIHQVIGRAVRASPDKFTPSCLSYIEPIEQNNLDNSDSEHKPECSICMDSIESEDWGKISCTHTFHFECIHKWLRQKKSCPLCRLTLQVISELSLLEKEVYKGLCKKIKEFNTEQLIMFIDLVQYGVHRIKVPGFNDLALSLRLINWVFEVYGKGNNNLNYVTRFYSSSIRCYSIKLFGIFRLKSISPCVMFEDIELAGATYTLTTTLAQANFLCWFISMELVIKEIVNLHKLFLLPNNYLLEPIG